MFGRDVRARSTHGPRAPRETGENMPTGIAGARRYAIARASAPAMPATRGRPTIRGFGNEFRLIFYTCGSCGVRNALIFLDRGEQIRKSVVPRDFMFRLT